MPAHRSPARYGLLASSPSRVRSMTGIWVALRAGLRVGRQGASGCGRAWKCGGVAYQGRVMQL